jgi:hypothetical protein
MRRAALPIALSAALTLGCASPRPVLYPNDHYRSVGREVAEVEIEQCRVLADDAGAGGSGGEEAGEIAKQTAGRAGAGAAAGAAGGAITGNAGIGAAIGAASAAAWSAVWGGFRWLFGGGSDGDAVEKRFMERCLRDRGYDVVGWK